MKKNLLKRTAIGIPAGIAVTTVISVIISIIIGDGNYYPTAPELVSAAGSELNAVLIQTVGAALYGAMFGCASVIWDVESWSLLRMTVTHLTVVSIATFPAAWILRWMPHSLPGGLGYFAIFFAFYAVIWFCIYLATKHQVKKMNERLNGRRPKSC